ncbi:hypothetical protein BTO05_02570 [Winogradskyella sp. PC-19]|uniref:hypothetical protein n=1 Tax=unclassified Winogradskyella TaxID=2615021 RepID=UPI000B3C02DE|nr:MULTISPECIES: hypothetical protein [unclassified Winogradskyella]ARV08577.1 hypothetical protein BTO05_02570 [Winogradskyella sp. PC-19]
MKKELLPIKTRIKIDAIFGIVHASIMAGFDYFDDKPFSVWQFLFYFFFMGLFMSLIFRHKQKKQ